MKLSLDLGSTTLKCVITNDTGEIIYKDYVRHYSQIISTTVKLLETLSEKYPEEEFDISMSGSAGMGIAEKCGIPFVQEVYATRLAVKKYLPETDAVIEIGGEDAKILFLSGEDGLEVRMNGSCAGGTGAFIDQMATLLEITPDEMNELAKKSEKTYTIASRCGVFAKSDIQPLLNQGAQKSDISASIFAAVVNQTIAGLAQGREINGNVVYLGGPLTFISEVRTAFDKALKLHGTCPENSLYFVAIGAGLANTYITLTLKEAAEKVRSYSAADTYKACPPLFKSKEEYAEFKNRHNLNKATLTETVADSDVTDAYIGIDAGSTTVKAVVMNPDGKILHSIYKPSSGNPVGAIKDFLSEVYEKFPNINVLSSAVTGYGEDIIKNAFGIDIGIVETIAHFTAAKKYLPEVDFIIDIGGQDIKCFKIHNGTIDNIFLNEACSSGCGSFLQTFAGALGYSIEDFANLALFADRPVDLGSRCTVFMNSSVKQAQKDGATIDCISAGLAISVVKNSIYKVIRATSADALGKNIVVQGGTFLNDAVLRAFELEINRNVIRPEIAGLMGAYGAAVYAAEHKKNQKSTIISPDKLKTFTHQVQIINCGGCSNNCCLTVNKFSDGNRYIGGNRCEKPLLKGKASENEELNLFDYKLKKLASYKPLQGKRGTVGIPMGLNIYELLPFWYTLFTKLGFEVVTSPESTRKLYLKGQNSIPSDTVCYPAKLIHGHIQSLIDRNVDAIFYPCMTFNLDEGLGDNHYNCPVVAYYPEVIDANTKDITKVKFIHDFFDISRKKEFPKKMYESLEKHFGGFSFGEVKNAIKAAYSEYEAYMDDVRKKGAEFMAKAKAKNQPIIVLSGRPYHLDPEINHGIDKLICSLGAAVITEDSVSHLVPKFKTGVLNQWTYHSRLYAAAKYVAESNDNMINLVQLVSFGCGVDAITTDEVRSILEEKEKIYTQIKIDEITNLGAVKIRLRSLFSAAMDQKGAK